MINRIKSFADNTNFTNALKVTCASVIPVLVCTQLGYFEIGFTIALGAFLTYPSDIPSSLRHKIQGIVVAALIVAGSNLLINLLYPFPVILYPVIAALIFSLSMISVYGHRANMVSFSGLLSVSLALGHVEQGWAIITHAGLMLLGGAFYLLVSLCFHFIRPHRYLELQMAEAMRLTAKYLKLRGDLWNAEADRAKIIEKQLHLQVELNAVHENIREMLMRNRPGSGNSNQNRKMLLVFISLVEIQELALSTSFDHNKIHQKFNGQPNLLNTYQQLAYKLGAVLKGISKHLSNNSNSSPRQNLFEQLQVLENVILKYETDTADYDGVLMLTNMLHYAEKQVEKINQVNGAFDAAVSAQDFKGRDKDLEKFLAPMYYPWQTFRDNLSFSSMFFRHSLRLTLTIMIGMLLGALSPLQNVYWILLTIVVIMRPGYGLTKQRSWHRIFGTLLGGIIAFSILSFVHNTAVIGALAIVSIILGFTYTTTNYKIGATFVTIYVIFVYGLLTPNIELVIQYRIVDTLVGAALSFLATYFLWPSWEFLSAPIYLNRSIGANRDYLVQISHYYNKKGSVTTPYRLARKNAFVEIGNLMTSYQRMLQEPKSKQRSLIQLYKLTVLNHTLLSSAASLGTYLQSYQSSTASKAFNMVTDAVISNLDHAIELLDANKTQNIALEKPKLSPRFTNLRNIRESELRETQLYNDEAIEVKMKEAQLIIEQLVWLTSLSENIVKGVLNLRTG